MCKHIATVILLYRRGVMVSQMFKFWLSSGWCFGAIILSRLFLKTLLEQCTEVTAKLFLDNAPKGTTNQKTKCIM